MNNNYVILDKASGRAVSSVFCQDTVLSLYTENGKYGHLQTPELVDVNSVKVVDGEIQKIDDETSQNYREARMYAYPSMADQLDAIWHAMDQGILPKIEPMYSQVQAVKHSIPKSNN